MTPLEKASRILASIESLESEWPSYVGSVEAVLNAIKTPGKAAIWAAQDREDEIVGLFPSGDAALKEGGVEIVFSSVIDAIISQGTSR